MEGGNRVDMIAVSGTHLPMVMCPAFYFAISHYWGKEERSITHTSWKLNAGSLAKRALGKLCVIDVERAL